jgi:glycosyltransferase involved in cell wall biosynthesis
MILGYWHDLRIYRLIKQNKYDFVQVRDKVFVALVAVIAVRRNGPPFYYWMSFPFPEADIFRARDREINLPFLKRVFYRVRGILTGWVLYKFVLPRANHVFVQSDTMALDVEKKGVPAEKMTPVPMGINLDSVRRAEASGVSVAGLNGKRILLYVGTMTRVRKIEFLLQMLDIIIHKYSDVLLVLVGDAPEKDMQLLRDETRRLDLEDHVLFTGFLPMEQAWGYIQAAKICLSPIRPSPILDVGSPTKIIEYMAFRKPVVANDNPDQKEVLNTSGAGRAVEYIPESFAVEIIRILENPEEDVKKLDAGFDYVRKNRSYFALTKMLENKYWELLDDIDKQSF